MPTRRLCTQNNLRFFSYPKVSYNTNFLHQDLCGGGRDYAAGKEPPKGKKMVEIEKDIEVMENVALSEPLEEGFERENVGVGNENEIPAKGGKILVTVKQKFFDFIKRVMEVEWVKHFLDGNLERTRTYHVWPGKNVLL